MARASINTPEEFIWEGTNKKGIKIRGEDSAPNLNAMKALLRQQGINPTRVRKKPKPLSPPKIKPADIAHFSRQLTTMMNSGVPMVQSLELIASGHENTSIQKLVRQIRSDIEGGSTLAQAFSKHPKYFDDLFVGLVQAGEQSGTLETMLDKIATYKEKTESMKAKVKKAMMYPIMVIVAAIVVSVIMLIWVIPQFKEVFSNFGADLPAFTLMVINLSEWLQAYWWQPLLILIIGGYAFIMAKQRSPKFRRQLDLISLKIPVMGNIFRLSAVARFTRTLSTMFAAGVPLVEAMDSVADSTGNALYREATHKIKEDTSHGVQLYASMQTRQVFPSMVIQMTKIGEESGKLEEMLGKVADYYEEQVDNLVDTLSKQIEPMIMAILGVVVGGLVIAMYLPIFKLGAVV
jgi:type IV pilus assembly protein PilC